MWHSPQGTYRIVGERKHTHEKMQGRRDAFILGFFLRETSGGSEPWAERSGWMQKCRGEGSDILCTSFWCHCLPDPLDDLLFLWPLPQLWLSHHVQRVARSPWTSPSFRDVATLSKNVLHRHAMTIALSCFIFFIALTWRCIIELLCASRGGMQKGKHLVYIVPRAVLAQRNSLYTYLLNKCMNEQLYLLSESSQGRHRLCLKLLYTGPRMCMS